jgi:hypothetical protein
MIVEGVNFIENEVVKWKRKDFIDTHKKLFFLDREEFEREKILGDIYDRIKGLIPDKGKLID